MFVHEMLCRRWLYFFHRSTICYNTRRMNLIIEVMGSCWLWSEFYNSKVAKCWVILHVIELTYILIPFMLSKVSFEVKSQCIEKDCLGDHIRVVNRTTGKCISCYACLDCHVGSPSVACGATVTDATDIDCDGPRPDLSQVSTASSYATSGNLTSLVSSSVSLSHTILVESSLLITTALITSSTPSEIIHPSSSVAHPPSSTVQTQSGSNSVVTQKNRIMREFAADEIPKPGSNTSIYKFGGISLVIILLLIVCRYRFKRYQHLTVNEPASNNELSCVVSSDRESEVLALCPVTSAGTAMKDKEPQKENVNQDFQSDEALIDEIPSSLESNMEGEPTSEGENQNLELTDVVLVDLSPESHQPANRNNDPPALNNSTSIVGSSFSILVHNPSFKPSHQIVPHSLHVWNTQPGELHSGRPANWQAIPQIEKYATKMLEVPIPLFHKICLLLDVKRTDGKDASLLAHELGFSVRYFGLLQHEAQTRATTTTYIILTEHFNGTVGDFVNIMKNMERNDIICQINEWNG